MILVHISPVVATKPHASAVGQVSFGLDEQHYH